MSLFDVCKKSLTSSLYHKSHCFQFKHKQIQILDKPKDFYEYLKTSIDNAEKRIFFASLYLGKKEEELIHCLSKAMKKNKDLKLYFIVDGLRGTRETPNPCSASLLATLCKDYGDRVDIRCYKTPSSFRWQNKFLPKRINEGIGLQHMKIYGFDDEVVLSGANLSKDYFTNRQDRYYIFKGNKSFSNYYFNLHQMISQLSFKVLYDDSLAKYKLQWPSSNSSTNPEINYELFLKGSSKSVEFFLKSPIENNFEENNEKFPTLVYPVSQLTPLFLDHENDCSTEKPTLLNLFKSLNSSHAKFNWDFTTGYFNMLPALRKLLISSASTEKVHGNVITASAFANGFYKSKGISGLLPDAYHHLAFNFLKKVKRNNSNISLSEWKLGEVNKPNGWSYHAKGIWITPSGEYELPILTTIGSSNYTSRAYTTDLENDCIILTSDENLRLQMKDELKNIKKNTKELSLTDFKNDPHKRVKLSIKIMTKMLENKL
ncbi:hypothetical protein ACO0SA_002888 [Hanseniaspora valbyensis]